MLFSTTTPLTNTADSKDSDTSSTPFSTTAFNNNTTNIGNGNGNEPTTMPFDVAIGNDTTNTTPPHRPRSAKRARWTMSNEPHLHRCPTRATRRFPTLRPTPATTSTTRAPARGGQGPSCRCC